ncbi:MAG: DUF2007 domain-containing protein [Bacteroidales bacterium]
MHEKLLLKCTSNIWADEVVSLLNTYNIASRHHDESQDQRHGAYGPVIGIAIYVYEKDYEKANDIIKPILKKMNDVSPFCPKCGSEDVARFPLRKDNSTLLYSLCIFLILIPLVYIGYCNRLGFESPSIANYIALAMVLLGLILSFVTKHIQTNHKCNKCDKKFYHY